MAAFCKQRPTGTASVREGVFTHSGPEAAIPSPLPSREHSLDKAATYHTLGKQALFSPAR